MLPLVPPLLGLLPLLPTVRLRGQQGGRGWGGGRSTARRVEPPPHPLHLAPPRPPNPTPPPPPPIPAAREPHLHILLVHGKSRQLRHALAAPIDGLNLGRVVCRAGDGLGRSGIRGRVEAPGGRAAAAQGAQLETWAHPLIMCSASLPCGSVPAHRLTCRQQRRQQLEMPMPGRQVGGGVAPGVRQTSVGAAPQQQPGGCKVAVPAGL